MLDGQGRQVGIRHQVAAIADLGQQRVEDVGMPVGGQGDPRRFALEPAVRLQRV